MSWEAEGLPQGLTLDEKTGRLTGKVAEAGVFDVRLGASNALGRAERSLRLVIGEEIALTPPLGWNSWNCWSLAVDDARVRRSAEGMVQSGLADLGWTYINIDDSWQGTSRDRRTGAILPNEKFPDMSGLCEHVHALGLKIGIYSTPWVCSYGGYMGSTGDRADGVFTPPQPPGQHWYPEFQRVGAYRFDTQDAAQFAAWGFDYLKYDWYPNDVENTRRMYEALRASGRDVVLSLSCDAWHARAATLSQWANCWRVCGDVRDGWSLRKPDGEGFHGILDVWDKHDRWSPFTRPGHWSDADMLVVGQVGWDDGPRPSHLTYEEQRTHVSLWCLWASPLLIGSPLDRMDAATLALLTNPEVLAVNQDCLGVQGVTASAFSGRHIVRKPLADGALAVGLFNRTESPLEVPFKVNELGIPRGLTCRARDLWERRDLGEFQERYALEVPPHGVRLLRLEILG